MATKKKATRKTVVASGKLTYKGVTITAMVTDPGAGTLCATSDGMMWRLTGGDLNGPWHWEPFTSPFTSGQPVAGLKT